jgi:hypothetical protein
MTHEQIADEPQRGRVRISMTFFSGRRRVVFYVVINRR